MVTQNDQNDNYRNMKTRRIIVVRKTKHEEDLCTFKGEYHTFVSFTRLSLIRQFISIIHTELNLFPAVTSTVALTFRSTVVRLRDFSRVGSFLSTLQHIFFVGNLCAHYLRTSIAQCCAARVALPSLRRTPKRSVFTFEFYPKFAIATCFRMRACSQPGCVYAPVNKANPFSTLCFSIFPFACYILHQ